ncbi:MAG: hypothetical protein K5891_06965 [Lachnospiraceae bacterium]|nr:hypothetical protein [Lachnospiraceae bacterium]
MAYEMIDRRKEIQEAIYAADHAISALERAGDFLRKASGWGVWDILGGGFITTFMKHARMNDAEEALEQARAAVRTFGRELRDVEDLEDIRIDTGDFLSFADYFWDGALTDILMQSRIGKSRRQVEDAIMRISRIREHLVNLR